MGVTRRALRREIATRIDGCIVCTATAGSTAASFTDTLNLAYRDGHLRSREAFVSLSADPANAEQSRLVMDNTANTRTVSFNPSFPAAFVAGDEVELWRNRSMGPGVREVHDAINHFINDAGYQTMVLNLGTSLSYTTGNLIARENLISRVEDVQYQNDLGSWGSIPPADWETEPATHTIRLKNGADYRYDTRTVRVIGSVRPGGLFADNDETDVNADWLVNAAAATLLLSMKPRSSDQGNIGTSIVFMQAQADRLRPKVMKRLRGAARLI